MKRSLFLGMILLFFQPLLLLADKSRGETELDLSQRYALLAAKKPSDMQQQLDEAAAAGYRIVGLWGVPEMRVLMEKTATAVDSREYLLVAVSRIPTFEKELNEAAAKGFRLLPRTLTSAKTGSVLGTEGVAVMEKVPGPAKQYQYLVLNTTKFSTMQKEMRQATEEGYTPVAMQKLHGELTAAHIVYLERPADAHAETPALPVQESDPDLTERYVVHRYHEPEFDEAVAAGYRVILPGDAGYYVEDGTCCAHIRGMGEAILEKPASPRGSFTARSENRMT